MKWQIEEVLQDGNRYIVRGKATGTPVKPFFGVEPSGKSFKIMSIDIHTIEDGKITHLNVEEPGAFEVSSADYVMGQL